MGRRRRSDERSAKEAQCRSSMGEKLSALRLAANAASLVVVHDSNACFALLACLRRRGVGASGQMEAREKRRRTLRACDRNGRAGAEGRRRRREGERGTGRRCHAGEWKRIRERRWRAQREEQVIAKRVERAVWSGLGGCC